MREDIITNILCGIFVGAILECIAIIMQHFCR